MKKIGELEKMECVHPDLFGVSVLVPLRTVYRAFDWMFRRAVRRGSLDLADVEGYLNKVLVKGGCDPATVESVREEVRAVREYVRRAASSLKFA